MDENKASDEMNEVPKKKQKTHTSSAVKERYKKKTYKPWKMDLRFEDFDRVESLRGEMSRREYLMMLIDFYETHHEK